MKFAATTFVILSMVCGIKRRNMTWSAICHIMCGCGVPQSLALFLLLTGIVSLFCILYEVTQNTTFVMSGWAFLAENFNNLSKGRMSQQL
jgi:hypothetical protein